MTHPPQLVLGIDTHKDVHVAVVLDRLGRYLAAASFGTTDAANTELVAWTQSYGQVTTAGVEGTGSYGYRLAQHLTDQGINVVEVNRPDRARRRRKGKTDPVDAEAAARAVLAGDAHAVPKDRNGAVGELRALVVARRSAIKARTQATNQLRALLVDGDDELRSRLGPLRKAHLARACTQLAPSAGLRLALSSLGRRWLALAEEITGLDAAITNRVRRTAPRLLERHSVGVQTAAQLLITAGDNPDRLHSEAAFAAICGASPVQASSRQDHPAPAEPRRRPRRQQRPVDDRQQPPHARPTQPRLRSQTHRPGQQPQRDPAVREASSGQGALSTHPRRPGPTAPSLT
jgi:transposase